MSETNFWTGSKKLDPTSENHTSAPENHTFDYKWLIAGGVMAAALTTALIVNFTTTPTSDIGSAAISIDDGDQKINWSRYGTYDVELTESLTIATSGTYHLTGTLDSGQVIVNAGTGVVRLILDNVTIKNPSGPAILCYEADDLVIELVGDNVLEDGAAYSADYDEDVTGAIYSKADLTFGGSGSLTIAANFQDGIVSKDDLKFNGGTYTITAADDAIRGKDSVYIVDGTFNIDAKADAIKSTNETDTGKGFILIKAGTINIIAGDDGIHAIRTLTIDGGTINIKKSYEGIEAKVITINDGKISVVASDDGINAGGGSDTTTTQGAGMLDADTSCSLSINGGEVYVNSAGDGIDSNGYLYFNGGTVIVDGPTNNGNGALDAGVSITQGGGTVLAIGASGMAESLGNTSAVNNVSIFLSTNQAAGTKIEIKDSVGATIISHTSAKTFNHIAVGTASFKTGETYTLYLNDVEYANFTISGVTTLVGSSSQVQGPGQQGQPSQQSQQTTMRQR